MITHAEVARAVHIIDQSGIVDTLVNGYRTDKRGGKADPTELRLWFVGSLLAQMHLRSATVQSAHRVLTEMLPIDVKLALGVTTRHEANGVVTYQDIAIDVFYRWTSRLGQKLGWGEGQNPDIDDAERQRRHEVVTTACFDLMDVFDLGWTSDTFAIDDTGVWSWGRGRRMVNPEDEAAKPTTTREGENDGETLVDPLAEAIALIGDVEGDELPPETSDEEAEWLADRYNEHLDSLADQPPAEPAVDTGSRKRRRTKHYRHDRDARWGSKTSKDGRRQNFFGYAVHTLVQVPGRRDRRDEPRLVTRFTVTPARTDIVTPSLLLLDRMKRKVSTIIADRLYNRSLPDRWWDALHDRGIAQVLDLRSDEQGFIEYERVRWAAGWPHCPATPDHLGAIPRPGPTAPTEDFVVFGERIAERADYALARRGQYKRDGSTRYRCPALAGKVGCPLHPWTLHAAVEGHLPIIEKPPEANDEGLPKCCTSGTVTLSPPGNSRRLLQSDYWGAEDWTKTWNQRTYVEGVFGVCKNADGGNMHRGHHRLVGLATVNIMAAIAFAAYNTRALQQWFDRQSTTIDHPLNVRERERRHVMLYTDDEVDDALKTQQDRLEADTAPDPEAA